MEMQERAHSRKGDATEQVNDPAAAGLTHKLAAFAVDFRLSRAPAAAIDNAKKAILDTLGVSILAASYEIGRTLIAFANEDAASGTCTIWGTPRSACARDASLIN